MAENQAVLGYQHGFRQPCLVIEQRWQLPASVPWAELDAWLLRVFHLGSDGFDQPDSPECNDAPARATALAQRVLALSALLLRAGRVPAFEAGRVLRIRAATEPDQCLLTLAVPCAGALLQTVTQRAHQWTGAFLLEWCAGQHRNADPDALCERIDAVLIKRLAAMASSGKSTIHLLRAAHAQRMPILYLGAGQYQVGWGARARRIASSGVDTDSAMGSRTAQNKQHAATLMRMAGLPAPVHLAATTPEQALQAAQRLGWPLVVKPVDRDRGEGVAVDIRDEATLTQAFTAARELSKTVLVEQMVAGGSYRVLIVAGKLLYCVQKYPKSLTGDGRSTVSALVKAANEAEACITWWERTTPWPWDDKTQAVLQAQGLDGDHVPAEGQRVLLRWPGADRGGVEHEDRSGDIHPANAAAAIAAAELFGLEVAGVDFIAPDIRQPWQPGSRAWPSSTR